MLHSEYITRARGALELLVNHPGSNELVQVENKMGTMVGWNIP